MRLKQLVSDEDAVSPVIGVILMVAITVILAAVIGTFVLNLGESVSTKATAGVTAGNSDTVTLNSLGPSTDGIKCAGASTGSPETNVKVTETVGEKITCSDGEAAVVAYGEDVDDAVVYEFDN